MTLRREWRLRLVCCGRDDGIETFDTWDAADDFREAYTSGPGVAPNGGHDRAAILERAADE